jgi:fructokinase
VDQELDPPTCWCGKRGCLETWISGSGLQRDYASDGSRELSGKQIVEAARAGDVRAIAALDRYSNRLGRSLAVICNVIDPDTIVFGGGMSNVSELYQRLPAIIRSHVFSDSWQAKLVPARWGDSSGVRGAARLPTS